MKCSWTTFISANIMFYAIAFLILLVIFSLAITTLVIFVKLRSGDVAVLRKLPGYKPHLLYGNALEIAREPDGKTKRINILCTDC